MPLSPVNLSAELKKKHILYKRAATEYVLCFVINFVMKHQWLDSVLVKLIKMSNYTSNNTNGNALHSDAPFSRFILRRQSIKKISKKFKK